MEKGRLLVNNTTYVQHKRGAMRTHHATAENNGNEKKEHRANKNG
jgi:hypothetical protein